MRNHGPIQVTPRILAMTLLGLIGFSAGMIVGFMILQPDAQYPVSWTVKGVVLSIAIGSAIGFVVLLRKQLKEKLPVGQKPPKFKPRSGKQQMVIGLVLFGVGAGASMLSMQTTMSGGTYTVFIGLIVVGLLNAGIGAARINRGPRSTM